MIIAGQVICLIPTMLYARPQQFSSSVAVGPNEGHAERIGSRQGGSCPNREHAGCAQQRRTAFGVVILLSVLFAVVMPFATIQTVRVNGFLQVTQSIVLFADLITAVFLFAHFSIQPQGALLALASGYIFSGLFAFLQTLDFPGGYSAAGLISGTPSGAVWLFSFWRITFPLAVIAYVLLKDANESDTSGTINREAGRVIAITIACVLAATAGLTWVVAAGYLPSLYIDATRQTPFVQYFAGAMWLLNAIAIVLLFVRRGPSSTYGSS